MSCSSAYSKSAKVIHRTCSRTHDDPDFHPNFLDYDKGKLSAASRGENCVVFHRVETRRIVVLYQHRVSKVDSASYSPGSHNCHAFRILHPLIVRNTRRPLKGETAFWLVARHARLRVALFSTGERNKVTVLDSSRSWSAPDEEVGWEFYVAIVSASLAAVLEAGLAHVCAYQVCKSQFRVVNLEDLVGIGAEEMTDVARRLCR